MGDLPRACVYNEGVHETGWSHALSFEFLRNSFLAVT